VSQTKQKPNVEMSPCTTCHNECLNWSAYRYPCGRWKAWYDRVKPDTKLAKEAEPRKVEMPKNAVVGACGRIFIEFELCDLPKLDDLCHSGCCMNDDLEEEEDSENYEGTGYDE